MIGRLPSHGGGEIFDFRKKQRGPLLVLSVSVKNSAGMGEYLCAPLHHFPQLGSSCWKHKNTTVASFSTFNNRAVGALPRTEFENVCVRFKKKVAIEKTHATRDRQLG